MAEFTSTKPYMLRAIHEWCVDNSLTPHILVVVDKQTRVPMGYVKNGEIVLNLNFTATKDLHIDNEQITFSARFGGVSQNLYVPMNTVKGIFANENGQGMFFEVKTSQSDTEKSKVYLPKSEGIVQTKFKYMRYYNGMDPDNFFYEELFDQVLDPFEVHNLANNADAAIMKTNLIERMKQLRIHLK